MEENNKLTISTPAAIVVAGLFIAIALLITRGGNLNSGSSSKTLSEQVGVSKEKFNQCLKETDIDAFSSNIFASAESALKGEDGAGTPYSVIIGTNGVKSKINGAASYENVRKVIDEVIAGKVTTAYTGEIPPISENDHILGNKDTAQVTIIEYSDFDCPFCKQYHLVLKKVVEESNGGVAWVYRQFPLIQIHPNALTKAVASECVAKIKGNDAFWKYADLLFGLTQNSEPTTATSNL
jgi:hypothetical protein